MADGLLGYSSPILRTYLGFDSQSGALAALKDLDCNCVRATFLRNPNKRDEFLHAETRIVKKNLLHGGKMNENSKSSLAAPEFSACVVVSRKLKYTKSDCIW